MADGPGKKQLGKILLKQKLVTQEELDELLRAQAREPGSRLASTVKRSGKVSDADLLRALSEQQGRPAIDLAQVVLRLENLSLIPREIARQHLILPFKVKDDSVFLAMADPADRRVIDEIEFVTGRRVLPYLAMQQDLRDLLEVAYASVDRGETFYVGPAVSPETRRTLGLDLPEAPGRASEPPDPRPGEPGVVVDYVLDEEGSTLASEEDDLGLQELQTGDIPIEDIQAMLAAPGPAGADDARRPRILVVDDQEDVRRLLRRVLVEKGYAVLEAATGPEALQLVRTAEPHLLLLDAMLPGVHGFEICRRMKSSARYGRIPIILVTAVYRGWRFAEDVRSTYRVDAFHEKPFKVADVLASVERILGGRTTEPLPVEDELSRAAGEALDRGLEAYRSGDLDLAVRELEGGVAIDPLSFKLHYHLGLLYGRRDGLFEAIHELETAVDLHAKHFSALKNLAVLYQKAGFKHKAVEMWERALGSAPDDATRQGIKDLLVNLL